MTKKLISTIIKVMPNVSLNPQQQQTMSKIMSIPTRPVPNTPTAAYKVPTLGTPAATTPFVNATPVINPKGSIGNSILGSTQPTTGEHKSNSALLMLYIIGSIVILIGYTYFWLRFFNLFGF